MGAGDVSASTWFALASVAVIIAWNAFFVAAEYAFVSVRHTRLVELVAEGNRRAKMVLAIKEQPSRFISAFQLAVTLSSLALGAVGEPAVSKALDQILGKETPGGIITTGTISLILAFVLITTLHVVLGEIVPKSVTLANAEHVALRVVAPVRAFFWVFGPIIASLDWLSAKVTHALGVNDTPTDVHSEEELKMLVRRSGSGGVLEAEEQEMIDKVFDFSDTEVEDVMIPRPDVTAIPVSLTPQEALARVLEHPYTRYPVYGDDLDDVVGVLHVRTLFGAMQNGGAQSSDLRPLVRPPHLVPETKRLGTLLGEFRRTKSHMAIVIDEYGSLSGIVTLEDLIEEIVGEIADEFDLPEASILRLGRDRLRVEGGFPIEEFNERFNRDLPHEDYHTIGGFVFGEIGRAPKPGDTVELDDVRFVVADVDGPRILHVDATLLERPEPAEVEG
jgi:CBS domain containing-hemolysin-like protein